MATIDDLITIYKELKDYCSYIDPPLLSKCQFDDYSKFIEEYEFVDYYVPNINSKIPQVVRYSLLFDKWISVNEHYLKNMYYIQGMYDIDFISFCLFIFKNSDFLN